MIRIKTSCRPFALIACSVLFLATTIASAQNKTTEQVVAGTVTDAQTNEPVGGATIQVIPTGIYTSANSKGIFTINRAGTHLVISHTGYITDTIVMATINEQRVTIQLQKRVGLLEDVVVSTGYQKLSKEKVVGAVTVIDNKQLNQQAGTNVLQRLNHVASGLTFNTGKSDSKGNPNELTIRGLSTINGPVRPLIVLDNFIYEGDIANINPNDVENITLLKDAAATSLWGARAGNGVIVISTKKAAYNQKPSISISTSRIITRKPDVYYPSRISVSDFIAAEQFLFNKGYFDNQITNTVNRPPLSPAVELFLKRRNGELTVQDSAAQINALKQADTRNGLNRYFYQRGITQQYNLSAAGGASNITWLLSGSLDRNIYSLRSSFDKTNFHLANTYRPLKNLSINVDLYYTASKALSGLQPETMIYGRQIPYLQFADADGNALPLDRYRRGFTDTAGAGLLLDWKYYSLEDYKHDQTTTRLQELIAMAGVKYQLLQPLSINVTYQYQKQNTEIERLSDIESFYARDLINRFAQINYQTGTATYIVPRGGILNQSQAIQSSQNFRAQLNFDKTMQDHQVSAIAGTEIREVIGKGNGSTYYGYRADPLGYTSVSSNTYYPTIVPGFPEIAGAAPYLRATTNNRFVSFYGNLSYSFKQRYTGYGSIRKDASNTFGLSTNDKWNPLWSAGMKWDVSKEPFYRVSWLDGLQFRTSYGYSGNVDVTKTPLPVSGSSLNDLVTGLPVLVINNPANPLLRWEKIRQINFGIDFSLKNATLSGSIDYYRKKGTDLYGSTLFDYTRFPRTNIVEQNVASMKGDGLDLSIRSRNINRAWGWNTTLLFSYALSKTASYYITDGISAASLIAGGNGITPAVGYPLYSIAAYKWAGLDAAGDPQGYLNGSVSKDYNAIITDIDEKGITSDALVFKGNATPKYFGSLINEWTWKGFSASVNISYQLGYYFRKIPFTSEGLINRGYSPADFGLRWQKPGDEFLTNIPAFVYTDYPQFANRDNFYYSSEVNVLKAGNFRLQYINLGYSFQNPVKWLQNIQVNFNAANLGIIWRANKEGLDPDYPFTMPPPAAFTGSLKITF